MASMQLAHWATRVRFSDLPPSVVTAARRSLYNWIGCVIGGCDHPTVDKACRASTALSGARHASLLGRRRAINAGAEARSGAATADARHAALLNGIASHVHDYDDTHLTTIIHPTGPVASAALAFIEHRKATVQQEISGEALLCAIVVGIEAACKLGLAVWPSHYDIGWHITGTTGSIGAAVAVGKLLNLSAERMAHAIGLASVQVIGLREMFGSDTKSFHCGRAAESGLLAALYAEEGFTSSLQALEAKRGWANVVVGPGGTPKLDEMLGELGSVWEIESNAFKPFPCGIVAHPAIDACIQLHRDMVVQGMKIEEIRSITERVHPLVIELTSKRTPRDGLEAKFSVYHSSAVGLLYGKAGPAQYNDQVVTSPEVVALRNKIDAKADENCHKDEAEVIVTMTDGRELHKLVMHAIGSLEVPMTDAQLEEKFVDQCALVLGYEGAEKASKLAWSIGAAADVAEIATQL